MKIKRIMATVAVACGITAGVATAAATTISVTADSSSTCAIDGAAAQPCSGSYTVAAGHSLTISTPQAVVSPPPPPPGSHTVPAAPLGPTAPAGGFSVAYADAFGACLTDTRTQCSSGYARQDNTLIGITHANGAGNSNEIAAWMPQYNDVTTAGLDMQCRAVPNLGDSYSCGAVNGGNYGGGPAPARPFAWNPGPNTDVVFQYSMKVPANEGNMDPAVWATGTSYAWEIDFFEMWGWSHYPTTSNTWCGDGMGFPAVPHDVGGATGEIAKYFCTSGGPQFDPSAGFHTYTFWENGDTFSTYIDGVLFGTRIYTGFNSATGKLIMQNDMRANNGTKLRTDPHFPAGGNDAIVQYMAAYEPTGSSAANNPIIVPGTSVQ